MKHGKLPVRLDSRNLKLTTYLSQLLIPTSIDWTNGISTWGMYHNDTIGDCTCAAAAHLEMLWTSNAGNIVIPADQDILSAYSAITGYDSNNPNTDQGANELDVLSYWRVNGIANHKIGAFVQLNLRDIQHVKAAVAIFGGAYLGVQLPNSAIDQTSSGQIWDIVADDGGIDGGHAIPVVAYDATGLTCITWGQEQRMSWDFFNKYMDEGYAILSTDFLNGKGTTPSGFNLQQLQADLAAVTN